MKLRQQLRGQQMIGVEWIPFALAVTLASLSLVYVAACVAVVWAWRRGRAVAPAAAPPPVTVLKPLCGLEPELEENLASFCDQSYPSVQILFGAGARDDPALEIARRVAAAFPERDVDIVAGTQALGANRKVNTLANLLPSARHELLVVADSDIRVGPTYLRHVVAPLTDASVGLVTCVYRGAPTQSLWSRLGALAIDEWFLPSVLVSRALGSGAYCSGATIALRRAVLDAAGGFQALAPRLADDHELGARVRQLGLRCVISRYEVATTVDEPGFRALVGHELRWMRTIRAAQPLGHAFLFITYAFPMSVLAALFAPRHPGLLALPVLAIALRVALHSVLQYPAPADTSAPPRTTVRAHQYIWLIPFRDLLSLGVWVASFTSRSVVWRRQAMRVRPDGILLGGEEGRST